MLQIQREREKWILLCMQCQWIHGIRIWHSAIYGCVLCDGPDAPATSRERTGGTGARTFCWVADAELMRCTMWFANGMTNAECEFGGNARARAKALIKKIYSSIHLHRMNQWIEIIHSHTAWMGSIDSILFCSHSFLWSTMRLSRLRH